LDAIAGLALDVKVTELGKQTGVIQMVMTGRSPTRITALVNAIADSYLEQHLARKQEEASRMLIFLDGELPHLKAQLQAAEERLSAYQQKSGTFRPSEEAQIYLQGAIEYGRQISALRLQETQLLERFTRTHPAVQTMEQQIAQVTAQMNAFQARFRNIPTNEANSLGLQRDVTVSQETYVLLLSKVQELQLTRAGTLGNVRILDRSLRPAVPIKPNKGLVTGASVFLGLILGILFVFIRRSVTVGIEEPNDIERLFGLPVMGSIPLNPVQVRWDEIFKKEKGGRRPILASAMPHDPAIEALRSFRTSMQFALAGAPNKLLLFSGPAPGTGKSFILINLATILAEAGQRVLLVDADMRRGHLNDYFGKPRFPGLSEVLAGDVPAAEAINQTDIANLWTMWSGSVPDRPSELLTGPTTRKMFTALEEDFDVVIIDTPPVLAVTDATIISGFAGSTFMVLRSGMHSEREIEETIKRLSQSGGRLVGGIFNAVQSRLAKSGRYSSGNYHYVYHYDVDR
jgi:tyrosine-protein kinase Etk/Wzc